MSSTAEPPVTNRLACPQCGGENALPSGERLLACAFCGATLFVDRSGLVSHYRLPRLLDRERAAAALRRWMAGNETVKDLDTKSTVEEVAPVSFPMWLFRVRRPAGEEVTVEPAAPTPVPQLADLDVPAGKLEPYAAGADGVEGVEEVAAAVPLETARQWLPGVESKDVAETALVHVPLWRCRYRFRDAQYVALVEGSTGAVLASVFPAKSESPYYLVAIVGLLLFGIEGLVVFSLPIKAALYALTAVPLSLAAWWVSSKV